MNLNIQTLSTFDKDVKQERGIPFELKIPNEETLKARQEAKDGVGETINFVDFIKESGKYAKSL